MPFPACFSIILLSVLLAACTGRPSAPVITSPTSHQPSAAAEEVLFAALGLVGTPYRYGGNTPDSGFDCSGLIGYVYRGAAGMTLPRTTSAMSTLGVGVSRNALQPGDLLFFATSGGRKVSHAAIYVGEGRFVHAPSSGGTVRLDRLSDRYWQQSYLSAKRVLEQEHLASNP